MIRGSCAKGWLNGCRAESSPGKQALSIPDYSSIIISTKKHHVAFKSDFFIHVRSLSDTRQLTFGGLL